MKCSKHIIKKLPRRIYFHQFRVRIITHGVFDALVGNLKILKSQKIFNYQIKNPGFELALRISQFAKLFLNLSETAN